jgi:Family of unknown function (DUF5522)
MADALADRPFTQPHPERLSAADPFYDKVVRAHTAALERGDMSYADPASGLSVLTAAYLAARGTCCGSGCRHCPYLD